MATMFDAIMADAKRQADYETAYRQGRKSAFWSMLCKCADEAGIEDAVTLLAKAEVERSNAVDALRVVCEQFGDNDWRNEEPLADVIERHLLRHLRRS